MSLIKVDAIESFNSQEVTINSDVKFVGSICATTVYVGETVITSGGTSSNQGYIWLLSEPITPGNKVSPSDNYFNIELFSGLTSNTLNPNNLLKIKVNNGDTSSTSRNVWWSTLQQNYQNALLQITYAGNASNSATIQISNMFGIGNAWQINGRVISGPPSGQTFPVYERHYLNWSFGPSSGGTGGTFTGNSFNQSADFAINTANTVNITGTSAITYFDFNYIDSSNINVYAYSNGFISSTTSAFTINGDYSVHIPNLPITTTTFYIDDDNGNGFNLNEYKYTLPIITSIAYNSGSNISTFFFSPILETTYYEYNGIGSSTSGYYSTAEGVSVNALGDYSHVEGGFNDTGTWAYYSSSIVDGVITIENMKPNDQNNILTIEKNNKIFIIFDDNNYEDNYGYEYFSYTSSTYNASAQTYTIRLEDNSINTPEALIACIDSKSPYIIPFKAYQHAEGYSTIAIGDNSHSEGNYTIALGEGSHAEGGGTIALEHASHAEGEGTIAAGYGSHAEGDTTEAHNDYSHAEGVSTRTYGYGSHAEGQRTFAMNEYSHTEGSATFTPSVYTYITSVDTNTDTITVINPDIFSVGDSVVYVRNANSNSVRRTYITSIDITGKTFTLDNTSDIQNNVFWGLNGNLSTIGVLFKLESDTDGENAHSEGSFTAAIGENSHAEGRKNAALGNHSHAEGVIVQAAGTASHAEGKLTQSNGDFSHAEGESNKAGINAIPALVVDTTTLRLDSSFGDLTKSISFYNLGYGDLRYYYKNNTQIEFDVLDSTIVKYDGTYTFITAGTSLPSYLTGITISIYNPRFSRIENEQIYPDSGLYDRFGESSHAEGYQTLSLGEGSHSEGESTISFGDFSHAEGLNTESIGEHSHSEGDSTESIGYASHSEGYSTKAIGDYSHSEGNNTRAGSRAYYSTNVVNGYIELNNNSSSDLTDVFGVGQPIIFDDRDNANAYGAVQTTISAVTFDGTYTYITCNNTLINGTAYIYLPNNPNPRLANYSIGDYSHSEGYETRTFDKYSHAEGYQTFAFGEGSHSEGNNTISIGKYSHSEGGNTKTNNDYSHAEGYSTEAYGYASHAEGRNTFAINEYSHTEGSATFTPSYYTYITAVNTGTKIITVTNTDNFNVNDPVAYVYNAGANNNQIRKTFIKSIDYTGKTFTLDSVNSINNSVTCGLNGDRNNIGVLFRLDANDFTYNHSEGSFTVAIGDNSHSEGRKTAALGNHSHAEGVIVQAAGTASHAEGKLTQSNGDYSHAEGLSTKAGINAIPADVLSVSGTTILRLSSSFGDLTKSISFYDLGYGDLRYYYKNNTKIEFGDLASTIVEYNGSYTYITASTELPTYLINQEISIYNPRFSRIENEQTWPDGNPYNRFGESSHAEGNYTIALGEGSHAEGDSTKAYGEYSHAEGYSTEAVGHNSHAEGYSTEALGDDSHAEGFDTISLGEGSHAEGQNTVSGLRGYYSPGITNGYFALNEPDYVNNNLTDVFIVGQPIIFDDRDNANAYGAVQTTISSSTYDGTYTWITCDNTSINGAGLIYLPDNYNPRLANQSIGNYSHAEGYNTISLGRYSHAEGNTTSSIGMYSHAEGSGVTALGYASHAEGHNTIALKDYSHASGKYNKSGNTDSIMVVGNGTNDNNRSDIFYINQNSVNIEGRLDNGYRTYRALLTHTDTQTATTTPSYGLIVGETYKIASYVAGDDFLSVGASSNAEISFTATGRYPTKWLCGSTLTVEVPTFIVNVLENSFDDEIVWELNPFGEGSYGAYFSGGNQTFPREKTSIVTTPTSPYGFVPFITQPTIYSLIESDLSLDDYLVLYVSAYDGYNNYSYNNLLWNTPIEIKSYVGFKPTVYLNSFTPNYNNGTADFEVTLASSGSSTVTEFGVVWSMSPNPTIADYKQIFGTAIGRDTYTVDFNGTTFGDYTYVRAYAINRAGVAYHEVNQISFIPND